MDKIADYIELPNAPATLFVFGLAGAGKSYLGELLQRRAGYYWYEGDQDLTVAMRDYVGRGLPFTEEMRDEFFEQLFQKIIDLQKQHERLVVTQAAYKRRHREQLQTISNLQCLWVDCSPAVIIKRLSRLRSDRLENISLSKQNSNLARCCSVDQEHNVDALCRVTVEYARSIWQNFEPPSPSCPKIINNSGDEELIEQILTLYGHKHRGRSLQATQYQLDINSRRDRGDLFL